jgi:hypothetical protein
MSFFQNLLGIIGTAFKFDKGSNSATANQIVSEANAIAVYQFDGVTRVVGRGLAAVAPNDWVVLSQLTAAAAGAVKEIRYQIDGTGAVTQTSTNEIPAAAVIVDAELHVTAPFDPGVTIALSIDGGGPSIMATTQNNPQSLVDALYTEHQDTQNTVTDSVLATLSAGGGAGGLAWVIVRYSTTLP